MCEGGTGAPIYHPSLERRTSSCGACNHFYSLGLRAPVAPQAFSDSSVLVNPECSCVGTSFHKTKPTISQASAQRVRWQCTDQKKLDFETLGAF